MSFNKLTSSPSNSVSKISTLSSTLKNAVGAAVTGLYLASAPTLVSAESNSNSTTSTQKTTSFPSKGASRSDIIEYLSKNQKHFANLTIEKNKHQNTCYKNSCIKTFPDDKNISQCNYSVVLNHNKQPMVQGALHCDAPTRIVCQKNQGCSNEDYLGVPFEPIIPSPNIILNTTQISFQTIHGMKARIIGCIDTSNTHTKINTCFNISGTIFIDEANSLGIYLPKEDTNKAITTSQPQDPTTWFKGISGSPASIYNPKTKKQENIGVFSSGAVYDGGITGLFIAPAHELKTNSQTTTPNKNPSK